jgi:hypothetical protein
MALTSASLTNNGLTTNFNVQYENTLANQANVIANANALLGVLEGEFNVTTGWFNTPNNKFGTGNRQVVNLNLADTPTSFPGANNSGYGTACNLDAQNLVSNATLAAGRVENVFMAEWVEILMSITSNWNAGDSSGEGLSQFCSIQRFQTGHYNYYGSWVDSWLNGVTGGPNAARTDWVNHTFTGSGGVNGDGDSVSFGCALAFIFYLNVQLGFSINQIIAAYQNNLATAYATLTGDHNDPFPFFLNLISSVYPASSTASIPGPVIDNPFPMAMVAFADSKNTFGVDEATDIINRHGGLVNGAFWVMVDGFSKQSFNALNIQARPSDFSGDFFNLPGVHIQANPIGPQFQNGVNDTTPQRIGIPFDIVLSNPFPSQTPGLYGLSVTLTSNGIPVSGGSASTQFELLAGADPYFTNINPSVDNQAYLSQDLRVFSATPALNAVPIAGGPTLTDSVSGAFTYIQNLLTYLNSNASFTNPSGTDPFTTVFPDQTNANQGDSSVTPFTLDFGHLRLDNNYNFAVARVRLQGSSGVIGEASNVRVFFRLFSTQSNDTDYDINSTYKSTSDASGKPGSPQVGSGNTTIPFFATGNLSSNTDYSSGGANIQTIEIPNNQDSVYKYYGCFLNLYDPNNKINGAQVQTLMNGTHHCLVAQIAYDDAPIPQGASPLSWDQLAQRNLQVTLSDNPGPAASHRIPQTFDCRPSAAVVPPGGSLAVVQPDELMIDWGAIPHGSVATLYWPQVNSADVIKLASQFYSSNPMVAVDSHTVQLAVTGGISYVPIPAGTGQNFAGLFTVDLPPSQVSTGQRFNIHVRRLSSRTYNPPPPIRTPPVTHTMPASIEAHADLKKKATPPGKKVGPTPAKDQTNQNVGGPFSWRYVVGSFDVQIPVTTSDKILPSEENTLAIMKWRLQQMLPSNRWYPVLERYIQYISARVDGLGGNATSIQPSPNGVPPSQLVPPSSAGEKFTGKICEVLFDCFGDFEGFVLNTCEGSRTFKTCERGIAEVVMRACEERLKVTVIEDRKEHRIKGLSIGCCC